MLLKEWMAEDSSVTTSMADGCDSSAAFLRQRDLSDIRPRKRLYASPHPGRGLHTNYTTLTLNS